MAAIRLKAFESLHAHTVNPHMQRVFYLAVIETKGSHSVETLDFLMQIPIRILKIY